MPRVLWKLQLLTCVELLALLPLAVAHGHDEDMKMDAGVPRPTINSSQAPATAEPQSYFQNGEHPGLIFGHILFMTIGWVFVLPVGGCIFPLEE